MTYFLLDRRHLDRFHKCMIKIFSYILGDSLEVLVDGFLVLGNYFDKNLAHLTKVLEVCIRKQLVLR